jgi:hypothetical protein
MAGGKAEGTGKTVDDVVAVKRTAGWLLDDQVLAGIGLPMQWGMYVYEPISPITWQFRRAGCDVNALILGLEENLYNLRGLFKTVV